jgi:hypothetical protein
MAQLLPSYQARMAFERCFGSADPLGEGIPGLAAWMEFSAPTPSDDVLGTHASGFTTGRSVKTPLSVKPSRKLGPLTTSDICRRAPSHVDRISNPREKPLLTGSA